MGRWHIALISALAGAASLAAAATTPEVQVLVDTSKPGGELAPHALGVSYETSRMLPDANGVRYFRPDNAPLVSMFKTIGIKSLRIGGNSVDAPKVAMPSLDDVRSFFDFARAAGVRVLYSVRFEESTNTGSLPVATTASNVEAATQIAGLVREHYADLVDCYSIGNEPYYFAGNDYEQFWTKWQTLRDTIVKAHPGARFCGPDQNPEPAFFKRLTAAYGGTGMLSSLAVHLYAFGCSYKNPQDRDDIRKLVPFDAAESRERMLAADAHKIDEDVFLGIHDAVAGTPVGFRLTETNSYWFSGLKGASDSYASALWGLDYLYWWTGHGAESVNFHTGDRTGGELSMPSRYAAFVTAGKGYEARPLAYGMKLFDLGGRGRLLPATVAGSDGIVAYATQAQGQIAVTLINKEHGDKARPRTVRVRVDSAHKPSRAEAIFLRARNDDIAAGSADVTLGGAPIEEDGSWHGRWTRLNAAPGRGGIVLTLAPASAAVVRLQANQR